MAVLEERLDVLAADRADIGRHAATSQERLEQPNRLDVGLDRPGARLVARSKRSQDGISRSRVP
jgi:hypothetical protein